MDHPMDSSAEENIVEESHKLVNSLDKLSVSAASSSSNFKKKPVIIIVVGMACWICDSHMLPCFLIRCIVVGVSAFDRDLTLDVLDHPVLNLIYYMVVEVLPSALVLFILRKLPPKRVSAQYHPIK